jgi:ribosomal protein L2
MHPSDHPAGGGETSSQAFRASRMLVETPCFVFEF